MKKFILQSMLTFCIAAAANVHAYAVTDFTLYPDASALGVAVQFVDITDLENRVEKYPNSFFTNNSGVLSRGVVLANTLGYPNGKSIIKPFPSMEFGIASGAGVYKYDRYRNFSKDDPKIPGGSVNAALHFGTGYSDRSDITFKVFADSGWIPVDKTVSQKKTEREFSVAVKDLSIVSAGAKWRYNIVKSDEPSWLFNFAGVTASVAADFMHAKISSHGSFIDRRTADFSISDPGATVDEQAQTINVVSTVNGKMTAGWDVVSVTPEILVYADLFKFFSLYTGPAVSFNAGYFYTESQAHGEMVSTDAVTTLNGTVNLINAGTTVARAEMVINESSTVPLAVPKWTVGIELNFWMIKVQIEAATILTSPLNSFSGQVGLRTQF